MGILRIFRKENKRESKEINIHELENWLRNYRDSSGIDSKINVLSRDITSKVIRLNELLNELENAKLKEENVVPERVKNIFEGNKAAFIDKIRAFILELKLPEERENIDSFLESLSEKINRLSEDTQKNYFVLKEFVEDHIRPVVAKIKDIDVMISNARADLEKTNIAKIREIKNLHKKHDFLLKEIENLSNELEHTIQMKTSEIDRRSKFDSKIEQLKETKAFEEYKTLLEREKSITARIISLEKEIKEVFLKLEYALKKRFNTTQNTLLDKYSSQPVEALLEDASLRILEEIAHIKNNIKEIALKKEKREAIIKNLEDVTDQKIIGLKKELHSLKEELEMVISRLKDNHYERSLKERENWVASVNKNIEAIEKKQQDIEDLIERMNPKYVKQKIRDLLKIIDSDVDLK